MVSSRVKGNFHARFVGGVGGLAACAYPVLTPVAKAEAALGCVEVALVLNVRSFQKSFFAPKCFATVLMAVSIFLASSGSSVQTMKTASDFFWKS